MNIEKKGFKNNELSVEIKNNDYFKQFIFEEPEYVDFEDETYISFYIPCLFDVDDFLGTDVCSFDNEDYINLYILWGKDNVFLSVNYWDSKNDVYTQDILLDKEQIALLNKEFEKIAKDMLEECEN